MVDEASEVIRNHLKQRPRSLQPEMPLFARPQCVWRPPFLGRRWRELLVEKGYNGGEPITEEWFTEHLSGGHNPEAVAFLFPGISDSDNAAVADDKEARFRKLAGALPPPPLPPSPPHHHHHHHNRCKTEVSWVVLYSIIRLRGIHRLYSTIHYLWT